MLLKLAAPAALLVCALAAPVAYVQLGSAPESAQTPWAVESLPGSVVLAGGSFIDAMGEEFVRLAGGTNARVVLIPTAYGPTEEEGVEQFHELWGKYKPASIVILHTRDRAVANDPEFVKPLKEATAVWFLGGVQTRLIDTYENTLLHREVRSVFERGGVIGGNCAGAMALGETMIVCGEEGLFNDDVEVRPGLGIVPKMVADSHSLERNRIERLRGVIEQHHDHFGLGIDSSTAIVIERGKLRFIGESYVATIVPKSQQPDVRFDVWTAGDEVDLRELFAAARSQ